MKKYIVYIGLLIIGLLLGWLFFGNASTHNQAHDHTNTSEQHQMWTCSMHPQIMQPEPGDCPICGMDLIPAKTGAEGLRPDEFKLTKNAMALANIQTIVINNETKAEGSITLPGKIKENENTNVVQASYFSGRLEQLYVSSVGEKISKGQRLATLYSPELITAQQELITAATLKESQPELYKAVRNKLKLWKISDQQINTIEASGKVTQNFPIYATVSGTVSEKLVAQGDYVKQGQALLKIANLNTVWALFDVYENQIDLFKKGQAISIKSIALPGKTYNATIDFIDPIMNPKTRVVNLRVVLNNSKGTFKPEMFVEGSIESIVGTAASKISIPASALLWTGKRSVVYIKTNPNEPIFEMKEVTIGRELGASYEILEGLEAGDEVVVNGAFTVDAAAQLQGKKSMMNQEKDHEKMDHHKSTKVQIELNSDIEASYHNVINTYIHLKDALIKSDVALAASKSDAFRLALEKIPPAHKEKTKDYWVILHKTSKGINNNVDLAQQRKQFKTLSDNLIEMVKNFSTVNNKLYIQYCPMANDDKGAYWLSMEEQILNPYFGDMMLKCGEVTQIIE